MAAFPILRWASRLRLSGREIQQEGRVLRLATAWRAGVRRGRLFACAALLAMASWVLTAAAEGDAAPGRPEVINLGHSGDNTRDLLARLERDVLARRPDLVVVLVGTNDLLNSRNAVPLEQYRQNLRELAQRITARKIGLLLVTIPPVHEGYLLKRHPAEFYGDGGPAARVAAGNEVVVAVASEFRLPLVDLFALCREAGGASEQADSLFRNPANSGSEDGVHLTAAGYRRLGEAVAAVIARERLLPVTRIVCLGDSITQGVYVAGDGTASGDTYPAFLARTLSPPAPRP